MMSATKTNVNEDRVQEIEAELVEELAKEIKSSPKVLLSNKAIAYKIHEQAVEQAANEAAKRAELKKAEEDAQNREAVEKAMKILGISKPPELRVVKAAPVRNDDDCWREYVANNSEALPAFFCLLKTVEEASACRGALIGVLRKWQGNPTWTDDKPDSAEAVQIWNERMQMLLGHLNAFFKSIDVITPPRASSEAFYRVNNLLADENMWVFDGPVAILREIAEKKMREAKAKEAAALREERQKAREEFKQEAFNIFCEAGSSKVSAEKLARAVAKNSFGLSPIEAIGKMAVERQAALMRNALRELKLNQRASYSPELADAARPYFKASGLSEAELVRRAFKHKDVVSLLNRSPKTAGEGKKKGNEKGKSKKTNKKQG